jgi:hypothetical protein
MHFKILWEQINNSDLWIIGPQMKYGVLVSQYGGYLVMILTQMALSLTQTKRKPQRAFSYRSHAKLS